ncbi:MAG: GNAT family N-acetyltransferase [Pseudomonadales bacterium]|jgi:ribosomal protein S18 acetylase RimI-like enzyme|nr:GNAT family N-acetyltransferase [Pseudomonadales bacterium]MDP7596325.1 GNAT family N-acetyltransferase [Pseudomonadales bacterium]HJN49998.1 GNAT family N-acetyltransferase [Pseudomonadales bacterium]|tara:strand:+ start:178 stop:675 length:498 start_codon:yes stop_codon:yes gene_type:complete
MIESVSIRRADRTDIPAIVGIQDSALKAVQDPGRAFSLEAWQAFFDAPGTFTYLSEADQPFGFVTAGVPLEEYYLDGAHGELIALNILPTHWGHGYGKKLLVHGISVLKRRSFERAIVWVATENERAMAILVRLGFSPNGAERITNSGDASYQENCYELGLGDYF